MTSDSPSRSRGRLASALGLPFLAILGLALLALPRAFVHDFSPELNAVLAPVLAIGPAIVWVVVAVLWSRRPLASLVAVGGLYGVGLAIAHNIAWSFVFDEGTPRLGGVLAGVFPAGVEETVGRVAASFSSLITGVVTGLVCGLIAWGIQALAKRAGAALPRR